MDHVVYVDYRSKELDKILGKTKTMIIRGAAGRKLPYGRVNIGDVLFFIENNGDTLIKAKAIVTGVNNSEKLSEQESIALVKTNQDKLQLSDKQYGHFAGKRYIVLIEFTDVEEMDHFLIDKSNFSNMDDWLLVDSINNVKL